MRHYSAFIPIITMGIISMLMQISILRLLLSTFSGNELDIGITLSFWLTWVGIGSYLGRKINFKHVFALTFVFIALLIQPTVFGIKAIRPILSLEAGEAVSFVSTIFSTALTLFPLCFVLGMQFPLAVSYFGGKEGAGRVYGLEALGAFTGGVLFTFAISGRISAIELCSYIALVSILMATFVSRKKIFALLIIVPLSLYFGFYKNMTFLPWQGMKPSQVVESKYGEITIIPIGEESSIYVNGQLFFTYPDQSTEELKIHLPMTMHPSPSKILVVGGSIGTLKEFLKYPVEEVNFVELDPKIVEVSLKLLVRQEDKDAVRDSRVSIIIEDGRRFIKRLKNTTYDLIVLNLPPPSTAGINRFYTSDFFREVKKVLHDGGILAITLPQSTGYIGRSMQIANGAIFNSLKSVFSHVEVTAQEYGGIFASGTQIDSNPGTLEKRFEERKILTQHFHQYILHDAFNPLNTDYVKSRLKEIKHSNTDLQPSAYLYNLMLWSEVHGGKMLRYLLEVKKLYIISVFILLLISVSFLAFRQKRRVVYLSIFTTGFSSMGFMLAVLLAYQSSYGYVYEMIGILTATFMIGLFAGAYLSRRIIKPLRMLFYLELMTIILALSASIFFKSEFLFYVLNFLIGMITGRQFSVANLCLDDSEAAGKLYGIDLIGSFLGAFIPSIVLVPLFGIAHTLLFIAGMKILSAMMILSVSPSFLKKG